MKLKFKNILLVSLLGIAGLFGVTSMLLNKQAEEAPVVEKVDASSTDSSVSGTRISINDQAGQNWTAYGINPVIHMSSIVFDSDSGFNISNIPSNAFGSYGISTDHSTYIDCALNWDTSEESFDRPHTAIVPWYIVSFTCNIYATHDGYQWYVAEQNSGNTWGFDCYRGYNYRKYIKKYDTGSTNGYYNGKYHATIGDNTANNYTYTETIYSVNINSNGGSSLSVQSVKHGGKVLNYPTRSGWTFTKYTATNSSSADAVAYITKDYPANTPLYAQWSANAGRWIAGTFPAGTSDDWAVSGSIFMTSTGTAGEYSGTVTLAFGDLVKIPYYNGSSFEYNLSVDSYNSLLPSAAANYCFGDNGGNNHEIKCYAAGSYTFYFKDSAYDGSHKISVAYNGDLTAQHLAAKLMNFTESAGHCGDNDRFPAMRTIYLGLSSSEKSTFQGYSSSETDQFLNAYNRYTAWARALGENPWSNEKLNSAIASFTLFGESEETMSTVIIIISSSIALLSITALSMLVIKKRKSKEQE